MLCGPWPLTARSPAAKVLMGGRDAVLGTHKLEKSDHRRSQGQTGFWNPTGGRFPFEISRYWLEFPAR
jgi:hypothetical protein